MKAKYLIVIVIFIAGCASVEPKSPELSVGHIHREESPEVKIPDLVQSVPIIPEPDMVPQQLDTYTVSVAEVPIRSYCLH